MFDDDKGREEGYQVEDREEGEVLGLIEEDGEDWEGDEKVLDEEGFGLDLEPDIDPCSGGSDSDDNLDRCVCRVKVRFCCVADIPDMFRRIDITNEDPRIVYDPNCLFCVVEKCKIKVRCDDNTVREVEMYAAKIRGCLAYQVETRLLDVQRKLCTSRPGDNQHAIVCKDTARFNNAFQFSCDEEEMEEVCQAVNAALNDPNQRCRLIQFDRLQQKRITKRGCDYVIIRGIFKIKYPIPTP